MPAPNKPLIKVFANEDGEVEISVSREWLQAMLSHPETDESGRASLFFYPRELKGPLAEAEKIASETLDDYVSKE